MSSYISPQPHREPPALRREATRHHDPRNTCRAPIADAGARAAGEKIGSFTVTPCEAIMLHPEQASDVAVRHAPVFRGSVFYTLVSVHG
jgi:hypothetical protein